MYLLKISLSFQSEKSNSVICTRTNLPTSMAYSCTAQPKEKGILWTKLHFQEIFLKRLKERKDTFPGNHPELTERDLNTQLSFVIIKSKDFGSLTASGSQFCVNKTCFPASVDNCVNHSRQATKNMAEKHPV